MSICSTCLDNSIGVNMKNVAISGWLTVFATDMEAQGEFGQSVAPLIVA